MTAATHTRRTERWTTRLCEECWKRRNMPASEVICRRCAPDGGPRSWQLAGLREARLQAALSSEELASRARVGAETVLRAERPGRRVHTSTAAALAQALGTSVSELAGGGG